MNVYITYDRYEHSGWFSVHHISTRKDESIKHFKKVDLPDFIKYGPDDCHSFQLQRVVMTKKEYEQLLKWDEDPEQGLEKYGREEDNSDYFNFLEKIYERVGWVDYQDDILMSTDGCSDFYEILKFYGQYYRGIDLEDLEDMEGELQEELMDDDDLFDRVLDHYIRTYY